MHLAHLGFPILGDEKYGDFALNRDLRRGELKRMGLHAWRMAFRHPLSGAPLELRASLPAALRDYVAYLDADRVREYASEQFSEVLV